MVRIPILSAVSNTQVASWTTPRQVVSRIQFPAMMYDTKHEKGYFIYTGGLQHVDKLAASP